MTAPVVPLVPVSAPVIPSATLPDGTPLVSQVAPVAQQAAALDAAKPATPPLSPIAQALKDYRDQQAAKAETPTPETPTGEEPPPAAAEGGEPAPETTEGAPTEAEGAEAAAEFVIELPARTPNGEPIRIDAGDQETYDAFQRLQNGYMRGEEAREVRAQAREVIDEFEEFRESLQLDPLSVIESALSVAQGELLVRSLLAMPAIRDRLAAELSDALSDDEAAQERFRLKAENQRAKLRDAARAQLDEGRAIRQNAADVNAAIGRLVPSDWTDEQKEFFYRDARTDIGEWCRRNERRTVPPTHVAQILAPRLKLLGLDPAARRAPDRALPTRAAASAPAAAAAPAGTGQPRAVRTVEQVRAKADTRALVAASAPGASSPGRQTLLDQIDPNADVKTAIKKYRTLRRVG